MRVLTNSIPDLLQIELTYACNLNCPFCYNSKRESTIDIYKIDNLVKRVSEFKIPHVYLIGGEPTVLGVKKLNQYIDILSKNSSVVIVSNGYTRMENLSDKLAYIGISVHGYNKNIHESVNGIEGSFDKTLDNIKYYKSLGIRIRCVIVLTGLNYNYIDKIILKCIMAGADEVFIDRYEEGGIGSKNSNRISLKPTNEQFRQAITNIIKVRNLDLIDKENISFGTAIPFCIDNRIFKENLFSSCGAGLSFCAVTPEGNLRICNQSDRVYGNIFEKDIREIWSDENLSSYRNYNWLDEPCKSCKLVEICQAGCRVDANFKGDYCIDYALRDNMDSEIKKNIEDINKGILKFENVITDKRKVDLSNKYLCIDRYLKLNVIDDEYYLVTKYQGVNIGYYEKEIIKYILNAEIFTFDELVNEFLEFDSESIDEFLQILIKIDAIVIVDCKE